MNEVKNYDKIYDRAYSDGYAESINAGCSTGYAERYAERYAENYVENFKIGEAEAKIEVITELLRMGMSIKEGLQMANIDKNLS